MSAPNSTGMSDVADRPRGVSAQRPAPQARALDADLLGRDGALPGPRARARDGRGLLLRHQREDQRVHGRVPDPEPRPRAARRRGALGRVRPRLQRPDREGRPQARLAGRVDGLLARAPRARRPHRALHPDRAAADQAVRRPGRRLRPRGRALAGAVPDRRAARAQRRHRRDPQHLRPLHRSGADACLLEPRDHRRARGSASRVSTARTRRSTSTPARSSSRRDPAAPAGSVAARARRPAPARARLARPGGAPDLHADAARHADARTDQRERRDRHAGRLAPRRPRPRACGDQLGFPALHAPAGNVLGRRRDGAVPGARPSRRTQRPRRLQGDDQHRPAPDRLPPDPRRDHLDRPRDADRAARLRARSVHRERRHGRRRLPRRLLARTRLQRLDADDDPRASTACSRTGCRR